MNRQSVIVAAVGLVAVLLLIFGGGVLLWAALSPSSASTVTDEVDVVAEVTEEPEAPPTETGGGSIPTPDIVMLPTNTPVPTAVPTETPVATETPLPTETPAPTNTQPPPPPVVQPTNTPPPPPPTATPGIPMGDTRGMVLNSFAVEGNSFGTGQDIWFNFSVGNTTGANIPAGALGVMPRKGGTDYLQWFQASYGPLNLKPDGLTWRDHLEIPEGGDYTLRLMVCFDADLNGCLNGGGSWVTLSPEVPVAVR